MQDLTDDERKQVLDEVLMDELKAIREGISGLPAMQRDVAKLKDDMSEVKADIKTIKAVFTDQGKVLKQHGVRHDRAKARLSTLEANTGLR